MKLRDVLTSKGNDYGELDAAFYHRYGGHLYDPLSRAASIDGVQESVSVIMPLFNSAGRVEAALHALSGQELPRKCTAEVIVVDDGATDDSAAVVRSILQDYPIRGRLARHARNLGRAAARNTGASLADGEVLLFCDADVVLPQQLLAAHLLKQHFSGDLMLTALEQPVRRGSTLHERLLDGKCPASGDPCADWRYFAELDNGRDAPIPISNVRATEYFQQFGKGSAYYAKTLPEMVDTGCLSVRRRRFFEFGGFCRQFVGWGREDVFLGVLAICCGLYIVPDVTTVFQLENAETGEEHSLRASQFRENLMRYDRLLDCELAEVVERCRSELKRAAEEIATVEEYNV